MILLPLLAGLIAGPALGAAASHSRLHSRLNTRSTSDSPTVNTTYGMVLGTTSEYRDDVSVFKGIPYAASPTGSLRWKPPAEPEAWSGVYNATAFKTECAQSYSSAGIFSSGSYDTGEDCLFLNIWRPKNASETAKLPVYVWIYGGRFTGGSGDVVTYDGSGLATKDIIVVTFNYRLGPFGFLAHPDLSAESAHNSSGNYGVLDMIAAIQWVQSEISSFGGNPDQITVGGQSAGSAGALDMMYSPLATGLVSGVISESGARGPHDPQTACVATSYREKAAAEAYGVSLLSEMNISTIAELRNVSTDTLLNYDSVSDTILEGTPYENVSAFMAPPEWRPVVDGYVLTHGYGDALRLNAHSDVPILTGNNKDESGASTSPGLTVETFTTQYTEMFGNLSSAFFKLYPANNDSQADDSSNALFRDMSRIGTWKWALDWAAGGAESNVYTYYWPHSPPNQTSGAYHGSELFYVFNNLPYSDPDTPWATEDYTIEERMAGYWANFIKTGNPNGGNLTYWPPSGNDTKTMWLGDSWGADSIADSTRIAFWEKFYTVSKEW
ncbi:MAG: hypothetical protein M1834_004445 [Cirrosporium novae-zelandiae]|nr:MAG: hypothetical protein M1834_004445 [Cirrosporium novae-zelandiae]